jgi:hypothetical protein
MAGVELRVAARMLFGAAETLSGASVKSGLATDVLTDAMRVKGATGLRSGAAAVQSMGGPYFTRMADDLFTQAARVQGGGPTGPAIHSALDGASWLLARASNLR